MSDKISAKLIGLVVDSNILKGEHNGLGFNILTVQAIAGHSLVQVENGKLARVAEYEKLDFVFGLFYGISKAEEYLRKLGFKHSSRSDSARLFNEMGRWEYRAVTPGEALFISLLQKRYWWLEVEVRMIERMPVNVTGNFVPQILQ